MTDEVIHVTGLRETQRALYAYSQQMGDRVALSALRQGANFVKRFVVAGVPVRTGKLRRGFRVSKSRIYNGRNGAQTLGIFLSIRRGASAPYYGRFVNDGWRAGQTHVPGKFFVSRGFTQSRDQAVQVIVNSADAAAGAVKRRLGLK